MSTPLKSQAIKLRKSGYFYSEIAKSLGIAKSTARLWTVNAPLDRGEREIILGKLDAIRKIGITKMADANRARRATQDMETLKKAKEIVSNTELSINHQRIICANLFWCEGSKALSSGVTFTNSDPVMIRVFLRLLRNSFDVDEKKLRVLVHLHEYHDQEKQLQYWSKHTEIPLTQFHKPYLKPHTGIRKREGYPGCVSLRYSDHSLGKLLKMIYSEFSKQL